MPEELADAILENATGPQSETGDGVSVTQHPLRDQIAADRYLRDAAVAADPAACLARRRIVLPGAV